VTTRREGGASRAADRLRALGRVALDGCPVGRTIAATMPVEAWRTAAEGVTEAEIVRRLPACRVPCRT